MNNPFRIVESVFSSRQDLLERGRNFLRLHRDMVAERDCLSIIIMALIDEGIDRKNDIVRTVPRFVGHSYRHVAAMLGEMCGPLPDYHYWYRDEETKRYRLHPMIGVPPLPWRNPRETWDMGMDGA
jgi:hypothetical protein